MKRPPAPLHPDVVRKPQAPFGWLEAHLLHDHWLARLQLDATAVLLLLALAADRRGASYYSRVRMADGLGIDTGRVDRAVDRAGRPRGVGRRRARSRTAKRAPRWLL